MFAYWTGAPHRPARDMDLLSDGAPEIAVLEKVFRELCGLEVKDGLIFQPETVRGERIKDRGTKVPNEAPVALTPEFYDDRQKNAQWKAFLNKSRLSAEGRALPKIADALRTFLLPVSEVVAQGEIQRATWHPGGPWM